MAFQEDAGLLVVEERLLESMVSVAVQLGSSRWRAAFQKRASCHLTPRVTALHAPVRGRHYHGCRCAPPVIDFDQHGVRRFVTNLVQLKRATDPAPPPRTAARRAKKPAAKKVAAPELSTE